MNANSPSQMQAPTAASWSIVIVGGVLCAPASVPIPVLPLIGEHFGDPGVAQLVMTMPALGVVLGALLSGPMMDRFGSRPLLIAAICGIAICGALPLVQESRAALLAGRALTGFFSAICGAVTLGWIATAHADAVRARLIGYHAALSVAMAVLAVPVAGMLGERWGWRAPFLIYAAMLICVPLVAPWALRVVTRDDRTAEAGVATAWNLWPVLLLITTLACAVMAGGVMVPFKLTEIGVSSPEKIAWLTTLAGLPAIATSAIYGFVAARTPRTWLHTVVLVPMGIGLVLAGGAYGPAAIVAGLALHCAGVGLQGPYTSTMLFARARPAQYGRAAAMIGPAFFAGQFASGGVVLATRDTLGVSGTLIALGVVLLCGAAVATALIRMGSRERPRSQAR